ncbi:hypothetical protein [Methanobrevibacter millerae]|uniref:Polymorphic outer membrane protein repeat-containing protein n=1 Tax=Methanobrevibacter millerae TaxID=230361 RepID=A0A1G5XPV1_9EURY|nr:hypothetical protein [Methanobrevibacter millerae]SDA72210.1 polymorphic outer membrane protein repeat-containing protein [Methanobrevibacter millerae]
MKKIYFFLIIVLVFLSSVALVSAADNPQSNEDMPLNQEEDSILETQEINDDTTQEDSILEKTQEINDDTTQEDILGVPKRPGTFHELQRIIDEVPEGDWFSIARDYYAEEDSETLTIEKSIIFKGDGHTLDGKLLDRIMSVSLNSKQTVVLENLNFINGKLSWTNGAGLYISGGAVTLVNCTFKDNQGGFTVSGEGGALYAKDCKLRVLNSVFDHNHFERDTATLLYGGAIGVKGGFCIILDSVFKNNIAEQGSAIWTDESSLHVERCDFINNTCKFYGAIYSGSNSDIICCNFIGNKAMLTGSSICIFDGDTSRIESCNFIGDRADNPGYQDLGDTINVINPYLMKDSPTVFITNCTFTDQVKNACIVSNYRSKVIANNNWWGNTDQNKNEKPNVRGNVVVDDWYYISLNKTDYMPNEKTLLELSLKSAKDNSKKDFPSIYAISNIKATNATVTQAGKYSFYYEPFPNSDKGSVEFTLYYYYYNDPLEFTFMHDVKEVTVHNYNELADALENAQKQVAPNCIINLAEGNYKATKNIVLKSSAGLKNLVINGNNNVLDGNNAHSFLTVIGFLTSLNGVKVTISDATFKNFNAQDSDGSVLAMTMGYGEANLNNVKFIENVGRYGGALSFAVLTNVNINGCEFIKNSATVDGGAAYVNSINFNIKDTTFTQNTAKNKGGAVYESVRTTTIDNSKFLENTARLGGALYYSSGTVTCTGSEFLRNVATEDAGAVYRNGPFYDDNNVFSDNSPNNFEYTGSAEGDDISPSSYSRYSGSGTGYRSIDKITMNNHQISISNNKLTLGVLNQIFNKDFRNGHILVYIDGILVFNATTTDDLTQIIIDLLSLLLGKHEIKVVFTDGNGNTNTYTENITI